MSLKPRKIVIIGAGHVGSHCAYSLAVQGICDRLVLVDIDRDKAVAQAVDLSDAVAYFPHHVEVRAGGAEDCRDADIVVISAGPLPDKNQTRLDTLGATIKIVKTIVEPVVRSGFQGIFVVISNPVDVVAHYVWQLSGFPKKRVIGTGTALDSARLRRILAEETGVDQKSIQACSMGEHGDSQMVPWSNVSIGLRPLEQLREEYPELYGRLDLEEVLRRTTGAGWVILNGKGSTEFGIGTALAEVVRTIFHDEKKILPVSVLLEGEYGQRDVFAGVPALLGKDGVEGVFPLRLTEEEQSRFARSCGVLKEYIQLAKQY